MFCENYAEVEESCFLDGVEDGDCYHYEECWSCGVEE